MSKQCKLERNSIHLGDSLQVMAVMPDASVDMVFADPPYPLIQEIGSKLFAKLLIDELVGDETLVALELPGEVQLEPEGWRLERRLGKARKGSPSHALYRIR